MPGSEDAFADATKNYETFESMGEKVIAYEHVDRIECGSTVSTAMHKVR